ncbi:hypothetical protein OAO01_02910 [Oligoflexia bacterium]|nr:hypothetical protein [Oligoflexia bacterium]
MKNTSKPLFMSIDWDTSEMLGIPNHTGTPERNLLMAILERAILDYVGNEQREVEEAKGWLFNDLHDSAFTEFSFPWICQQLDLDLGSIVGKIKAMPKRGARRVAPWYFAKAG